MTNTTIIAGPVVIDQIVTRLLKLPNGAGRIEIWKKGAGWTEARPGEITLDEFMPGACRPVSVRDAARLGCRLEDFGRHWTEEPAPRDRAKLVHLLKERAWDLAARQVRPGRA
jgi:hypothetical protein